MIGKFVEITIVDFHDYRSSNICRLDSGELCVDSDILDFQWKNGSIAANNCQFPLFDK